VSATTKTENQKEKHTAMGPKDAIKQTLDLSDHVLYSYVNDLADDDLRLRPAEGMHPIALQLGHLIVGENAFCNMITPGAAPPLPDGFKEAHDLKNKELSDSGFVSKDKYVELLKAQRTATKAILDAVPDSDLDDTRGGKLPSFAPTVGSLLNLIGMHPLMHAGQFVAVRRTLKKPIVF
jgi:DinB superfamily